MAYPCSGPRLSVRRISKYSVPGSSSGAEFDAIFSLSRLGIEQVAREVKGFSYLKFLYGRERTKWGGKKAETTLGSAGPTARATTP
jgi:hypothetical protein